MISVENQQKLFQGTTSAKQLEDYKNNTQTIQLFLTTLKADFWSGHEKRA